MGFRFIDLNKGEGINSIPVRFGLAATLVAFLAALSGSLVTGTTGWMVAMAAAVIAGVIFYGMGSMLTKPIRKLESFADTYAGGDFDAEAEIACACEVGRLGDSIRGMVSNLKTRELALQDAHAKSTMLQRGLADAIDAMEEQFLLFDEDDRLILANRSYKEAMDGLQVSVPTGVTFDEMITAIAQSPVLDLSPPQRRAWIERQHALRKQALAAGKPIVVDRDDGRSHQIAAYKTAHGNFVDQRREVTDLKARERHLETALEQAKAGQRAKDEFLDTMSHEIRTPMNGVLAMTQLLAMTKLDDKQRSFADIIVKSGQQMLNVINDILEFTKLSSGTLELENEAFAPADLASELQQAFDNAADDRGNAFVVRLHPDLPGTFVGDALRIRQLAEKLIDNAIKYTDQGEVEVEIAVEGGSGLRLSVRDTGCGIDHDKLELIFEAFRQADSSSTRSHDGLGLGLAAAHKLALLMGGTITVESSVGSGSTFVMILPLAHGEQVASPSDQETERQAGVRRVLVIGMETQAHDEELERKGFDVARSASLKSGLAILSRAAELGCPVDAIILDVTATDQVPQMLREISAQSSVIGRDEIIVLGDPKSVAETVTAGSSVIDRGDWEALVAALRAPDPAKRGTASGRMAA
jgi:signal transduction histidine kinase